MTIWSGLGTWDLSRSGVIPPPPPSESPYPPPPPAPGKWKFGQDSALGIWVGLEYPHLPLQTYVGASVWRLIFVSPKDTVSFVWCANQQNINSKLLLILKHLVLLVFAPETQTIRTFWKVWANIDEMQLNSEMRWLHDMHWGVFLHVEHERPVWIRCRSSNNIASNNKESFTDIFYWRTQSLQYGYQMLLKIV